MSDSRFLGIKSGISHSNICFINIEKKESVVLIEERISRVKYKGGFPSLSLKKLFDFDRTVISIPESNVATNSCTKHPETFETSIPKIAAILPQTTCSQNDRMNFPSHHHCHLLSAIVQTNLTEGYILVCDGVGSRYDDFTDGKDFGSKGENEYLSLYYFEGEKFELIHRMSSIHMVKIKDDLEYPVNDGVGSLYMNAATALFGSWQSSGKVMGLAAYGHHDVELQTMNDEKLRDYLFHFPVDISVYRSHRYSEFQKRANIAFEVQSRFEKKMSEVITKYVPKGSNLILTGGTALNCVFNGKLKDYNLQIPPNPCDFGIGIGAASYIALKNHGLEDVRACFKASPFLGSSLPQIEPRLKSKGWTQNSSDGKEKRVIEALLEGEVIVMANNKAEVGARALGHRSLIAAPHLGFLKDKLNRDLKKREWFRPFGVCVLEDKVTNYFHCEESFVSPYMDKAVKIKEEFSSILKDIVHRDGSVRIQTVKYDSSPLSRLLQEFEKETSFPILINTSLNIMGEPICEDLADVEDFLATQKVEFAILGEELYVADKSKEFHIMNLGYEFELFSKESTEKFKAKTHLEYLYFFYCHSRAEFLKPHLNYPQDYLQRLKSLGVIPRISSDANDPGRNWYGKLNDLDKEKKLNSKIWMHDFLNDLNLLDPKSKVIKNIDELKQLQIESTANDILLKSPFFMSGIGIHKLGELQEVLLPVIAEPFYKRAIDFSSYTDSQTKETQFYVNLTDENGGYLGGRVFEKQRDFYEHYKSKYPLNLLFESHEKIVRNLFEEGAVESFSIDSYFTTEGKFISCCDINYRRNMGELLYHLRRFLPKDGVGEFIISDDLKSDYQYSLKHRTGILELSPKGAKSPSVFICAKNMNQLKVLKEML